MFSLNNLQINPSRSITLISLALLISGLIVLYHTNMPFHLYAVMSAIGVLIATLFILEYGALLLPHSVIRCDANEYALYLTTKNGRRTQAIPISTSFMSSQLLLLGWKPANEIEKHPHPKWRHAINRTRYVILTSRNASSTEDFRRLRVLLKFGKITQSPTNTETAAS